MGGAAAGRSTHARIFSRMGQTRFDITISLDGFVAGPDATLEAPLGTGGERLHEWLFALPEWQRTHGGAGGGERSVDSEIYREQVDATGAVIMGRKMFSGGSGPWEDDPNADAWWGDDPPFRVPVFVVTHHEREPLVRGATTFHFVTGGVEEAHARAVDAAGEKTAAVAGGAEVGRQLLRAGLVDELQLHVAPILLGRGVPLFADDELRFEPMRVTGSPRATHILYRVIR
jgi:dihydrofolate reductase